MVLRHMLNELPPPPPPSLALRYEGSTAVVDLVEFGRDLCKGRPDVNLSFQGARMIIQLDALVCSIILDNAISNAIGHCAPTNPSVHLEIAVQANDTAMESDETPVRVQFLTTNYTNSRKGWIERWNGTGPNVISDGPQRTKTTHRSSPVGCRSLALMTARLPA